MMLRWLAVQPDLGSTLRTEGRLHVGRRNPRVQMASRSMPITGLTSIRDGRKRLYLQFHCDGQLYAT